MQRASKIRSLMKRSNEGTRVVAFYDGSGTDHAGRTLKDVLSFDDDRLEWTHDFIQWLFPLKERSAAQPLSPILDDAAVESFRNRPELRSSLRAALDRMLAFYGFIREGGQIADDPATGAARHWLRSGNHNHLRLTRMLKALRLLGEASLADALFDRLRAIYLDECRSGRNRITRETFSYWQDAVT